MIKSTAKRVFWAARAYRTGRSLGTRRRSALYRAGHVLLFGVVNERLDLESGRRYREREC